MKHVSKMSNYNRPGKVQKPAGKLWNIQAIACFAATSTNVGNCKHHGEFKGVTLKSPRFEWLILEIGRGVQQKRCDVPVTVTCSRRLSPSVQCQLWLPRIPWFFWEWQKGGTKQFRFFSTNSLERITKKNPVFPTCFSEMQVGISGIVRPTSDQSAVSPYYIALIFLLPKDSSTKKRKRSSFRIWCLAMVDQTKKKLNKRPRFGKLGDRCMFAVYMYLDIPGNSSILAGIHMAFLDCRCLRT